MIMKWLTFEYRRRLLCFWMLCAVISLSAQDAYQKKIDKYHEIWTNLIPKYVKLQYAGSMGFLSFGTGWDYGKNNQWETDVFLGFIPRYSTDDFKITFTLKQNFIPWKVRLNPSFSLDPLACGIYMNTVFGEDFWISEPERYPSGYYSFSTKLRMNVFLGQRITYNIPASKRYSANAITFFYEISTNELYLISRIQNRYLTPKDYLGLSLGLKIQFF